MGCLAGSVRNGSWCPYGAARWAVASAAFLTQPRGSGSVTPTAVCGLQLHHQGQPRFKGRGQGPHFSVGRVWTNLQTCFQSTVALNTFAGWLEAKFPHLFCPRSAQFSPPCPPLLRHHDTGMCENWRGRAAWWPKSHRPMTHRLLLCSPGPQCGCLGHAFSKTLPAVAVTVTVTITLGSPFLLALCQGGRRGSPWGFAP